MYLNTNDNTIFNGVSVNTEKEVAWAKDWVRLLTEMPGNFLYFKVFPGFEMSYMLRMLNVT